MVYDPGYGRDRDLAEKSYGRWDDVKITKETCAECGGMLPDTSYDNLLSFLRFCSKCQYNFFEGISTDGGNLFSSPPKPGEKVLVDWGTDKIDVSGYGRLLHGFHEVIKTKKPDKSEPTTTTYSPPRYYGKKKKSRGNFDWVKGSLDYD